MDKYTPEHLKDLNAIREDAIQFCLKLRGINAVSPQEEKLFIIFLEFMDREIFEIKFILELERELSKK